MSDASALETCLAPVHRELGGSMVEFGGWIMPLQYSGIREEHVRTRTSCSLFDVSHMGRVKIHGPDAIQAIERLCPLSIDKLEEGQSHYSFLLDHQGGTIDDLLVTRDLDGIGVVINAANRLADIEWMKSETSDLDIRFLDMTEETAMIAVQGPQSPGIVGAVASEDPSTLPYYHARVDTICGQLGIVSATGYTGENGFELTVPASIGPQVWMRLLEAGGDRVGPAGLGARDTLRLEAAMPLYGHELSREINPLESGLKRFVDFDNERFIGFEPTRVLRDSGLRRKMVCLRADGRKVAREGATLTLDGSEVGRVTSGTFSPTLEAPIAMAMVTPDVPPGSTLVADVRGKPVPMKMVKRPFYRRPADQ